MKQAQTILHMEYGNAKNFMTPNIIEIGKISDNIAYEISSGEGLSHNTIYGLSIVSYNPETNKTSRDYDGSGCYDTLAEVNEIIDNLKNN